VEGEDVSFHLSLNGKLQISSPNNEWLRRAESQLKKLIVCSRWVPSGDEQESKTERVEYQSIMDLPEAKEADWSKIPKAEILKLNQWFLAVKDYHYDFLLDSIRSTLKSYAKSRDNTKAKETKSLKEKIKEWFN